MVRHASFPRAAAGAGARRMPPLHTDGDIAIAADRMTSGQPPAETRQVHQDGRQPSGRNPNAQGGPPERVAWKASRRGRADQPPTLSFPDTSPCSDSRLPRRVPGVTRVCANANSNPSQVHPAWRGAVVSPFHWMDPRRLDSNRKPCQESQVPGRGIQKSRHQPAGPTRHGLFGCVVGVLG